MNTTNILLGATSLLLVVAFALSFGGFNKNRNSDDSKNEHAKIAAAYEEELRRAEEMRLNSLRRIPTYTPPSIIPPIPVAQPEASPAVAEIDEETKRRIKELEEQNLALKTQAEESEAEAELAKRETEAVLVDKSEVQQMNEQRGFLVRNAMEMGVVTEASKEYGQVFFRPADNASATFQPGRILSIRRNDGIVGDIEIDRLEGNIYVASMRPHGYSPDGLPDIKSGDAVIIKLSEDE